LIRRQQVEEAKEALILERATHLDSLVARLMEPRVRRVIEPLLAGELTGSEDTYDDDRLYVADLGLVKRTRPLEIANPIYKEIIVRVLTSRAQDNIVLDPHAFITKRGACRSVASSTSSPRSGASTARCWRTRAPTTRWRRSWC
jgi:hypothetical protein